MRVSLLRGNIGAIAAVIALSAIALCTAGAAQAQDWPRAKPVSIVVGFGPGAFTDTIARVVAQKLGETTGGAFVVENRPGAGGNPAPARGKRPPARGSGRGGGAAGRLRVRDRTGVDASHRAQYPRAQHHDQGSIRERDLGGEGARRFDQRGVASPRDRERGTRRTRARRLQSRWCAGPSQRRHETPRQLPHIRH